MSSTQSKTLTITYGNCQTMLSAGSNMTLHVSMVGVEMYMNTESTSYAYATLTDSAKNELFPNSTAHPTKCDARITVGKVASIFSATVTAQLQFGGTSILEKSTTKTIGESGSTTGNTASAVTGATKGSTIRYALKTSNSAVTACCGSSVHDSTYITLYFTRYDFSATAGSNVTAASVSSSTGYDGDSVTYSCVLASGAEFDGWYNGSTLVSSSQTYTHTVNGSDLSLTAKATASAEPTKSFSAVYGNSIIISQTQSSNVAVGYNSGTITTLTDNNRIKHLLCKNKLMSTAVTAGGKTLNCGGKVSSYNIPMLYCHGSWELNKGLTSGTATLVDASGWVTTPLIPVSGKINVTVEAGGTRSGSMLNEYDSGYSYASYWSAGSNPRTFTLDTAASFIRCTFLMSALANCSIYDNTNGKYLFKGGNV